MADIHATRTAVLQDDYQNLRPLETNPLPGILLGFGLPVFGCSSSADYGVDLHVRAGSFDSFDAEAGRAYGEASATSWDYGTRSIENGIGVFYDAYTIPVVFGENDSGCDDEVVLNITANLSGDSSGLIVTNPAFFDRISIKVYMGNSNVSGVTTRPLTELEWYEDLRHTDAVRGASEKDTDFGELLASTDPLDGVMEIPHRVDLSDNGKFLAAELSIDFYAAVDSKIFEDGSLEGLNFYVVAEINLGEQIYHFGEPVNPDETENTNGVASGAVLVQVISSDDSPVPCYNN